MADYIPKPGSFSLFRNDRKNADNHPDYAGSGVDLDGNECWINAWLKETKDGKKFFSISLRLKEPKPEESFRGNADRGGTKAVAGGSGFRQDDLDDEIPF